MDLSLSIPSEISTVYYQANLVPKEMSVSMTILFSNKKQLKQMGRGGIRAMLSSRLLAS